MDATTYLQGEHDHLKVALRALTDATSDAASRLAAFRALRAGLAVHSRVEEEVFYPAVMKMRAPGGVEAVRAALEDHHVVDGLVAELDEREVDDPQFAVKAVALRAALERHIAAEEDDMFAQARIHLTDERLERLGRRMESLSLALRLPAASSASAHLSPSGG
jgi:hypothetical protein